MGVGRLAGRRAGRKEGWLVVGYGLFSSDPNTETPHPPPPPLPPRQMDVPQPLLCVGVNSNLSILRHY